MRFNLIKICGLMAIMSCASCDSTDKKNANQNQSPGGDSDAKANQIKQALKDAGAMLPAGPYQVDQTQAQSDANRARLQLGDRGPFSDMHERQGVTLLPAKKQIGLMLNEVATDDPPAGESKCVGEDSKKICVTACATATANAQADAFAHASATACAWAQAWACVFTFSPFSQVCSWASSEACSKSFASAFSSSYATDTQTKCEKQCSE